MSVEIQPGETRRSGRPQALFQTNAAVTHRYAPARAGRRFFAVEPPVAAASEPIYVIANWPALAGR